MEHTGINELSVLDVLVYGQNTESVNVRARSFCAISFKEKTGGAYTANGERVEYSAGTLCLVPADVAYRRESLGENIRVIHFTSVPKLPRRIKVVRAEDAEKLGERFDAVIDMWNKRSPGYKYHSMALLYSLFALFAEGEASEGDRGDYLDSARRYMEIHFSEPDLTIGKLCSDSFVSPAIFRRRFGKRYGMSPKKYLDRVRIEHAKSLLRADYYTATEIAARCGFSDAGYFCTAFRRHTGESVTEYRTRNGK